MVQRQHLLQETNLVPQQFSRPNLLRYKTCTLRSNSLNLTELGTLVAIQNQIERVSGQFLLFGENLHTE